MSFRELIHQEDPYDQWLSLSPINLQGWGSEDENFKRVIDEVQPKFIIEIGSWLGASAIHMARLIVERDMDDDYYSRPDLEIVCVDTWLGSEEFWYDFDDDTRYGTLRLSHGYPLVYYTFLQNVKELGFAREITPFPATSAIAANVFKHYEIKADLIYVDGSHEYHDVLRDLQDYWSILRDGGIMFGDDFFTFVEVGKAVIQFCSENNLVYEHTERQWIIRK